MPKAGLVEWPAGMCIPAGSWKSPPDRAGSILLIVGLLAREETNFWRGDSPRKRTLRPDRAIRLSLVAAQYWQWSLSDLLGVPR